MLGQLKAFKDIVRNRFPDEFKDADSVAKHCLQECYDQKFGGLTKIHF